MKGQYRPDMDDFAPRNTQQLSLKDAGQFDKKFHILTDGKVTDRRVVTGWERVCRNRAGKGTRTK